MNRGEFQLIADLKKRFAFTKSDAIGIGDDCAIVNSDCLITTDALADGSHFLSDRISMRDLGWKSFAVNVSDIAAMGGFPTYALLTVGLPEGFPDERVNEFIEGADECRKRFGFEIIGGDTVKASKMFVSVTMLGKAHGKPLMRSGAKSGDLIFVTGTVGDSGVGLGCILENLKYPVRDKEFFLRRHYRPSPRVDEIRRIGENCTIHSCIDISDGFLGDLTHIADESGVGFEIDLDRLPVSAGRIGKAYAENELYFRTLAAGSGEDYELILTIGDNKCQALSEYATEVGRVVDSGAVVRYRGKEIEWDRLKKSFTHF